MWLVAYHVTYRYIGDTCDQMSISLTFVMGPFSKIIHYIKLIQMPCSLLYTLTSWKSLGSHSRIHKLGKEAL